MRKGLAHFFFVALALLVIPSCGGNDNVVNTTPPTTLAPLGAACAPCNVNADCQSGLTCQQFRNAAGAIRTLCGDANPNMTCPAN